MFGLDTIVSMNDRAATKEAARKLVTIENARAAILDPAYCTRGIEAIAERMAESAEDIAYRKQCARLHA